MMKMLTCKSESLANGEKQSERSQCVEMVADCRLSLALKFGVQKEVVSGEGLIPLL